MFEELLRAWDGEEVVVRFDEPARTWMLVCVHSTVLGPAAGGTRMKIYPAPADALRDVLRLSSAMTSKMAMAGVPFGGGKAVLAVPEIPRGAARRELMLRHGELVESLHGTYMDRVRHEHHAGRHGRDRASGPRSVFGRTEGNGGSGTSAPNTAVGVFARHPSQRRARVRLGRPGRADGSCPGRRRGGRSALEDARGGGRPAHPRRRGRGPRQGARDRARRRGRAGRDASCRPRPTSSRPARPAASWTPTPSRSCGAGSWPAPRTTSSASPATPSA